MDNKEIADIFLSIADILEIKDENVFRIRAYRTAAQNIIGLSRELSDVYEEDPSLIGDVQGIGKDLKEKIIEMVTTGHLEYYSRLIKEFPDGFLDMMDLSGLGPKKLKKLRDELGVKNVDDLEKACKSGKLEALEGMGAKTQEKLLSAIEHFRRKEGRMLLPEADGYSREIIEYLAASKLFRKIERAGSLRRGRETVGDLDILTVAGNVKKAMDYFVAFPGTEAVIAKGSTKSSISLRNNVQVDLRVIDSDSWGAALVYFTGSKQHNIKIRTIAKRRNYKISEYGIFSVAKSGAERKVAGKTEQDFYKKLGMDWIPPEMREDRGEVEAALDGKIPKGLVKVKDIKGDLHVHTSDTDGRMTIREMIEGAKRKGYEYVAITNHSKLVKIAGGLDEKQLLKHVDNIRKIAKKIKGIKVLAGVEVDILKSGKLDLEDYALKDLDIVIAAVHSNFSLTRDEQTGRILRAMDNKYVKMLAHPSGRLITRRTPLQLDFDRIFKKAAESKVILEVNTHGERIDLNDAHCKRAKELGAKFAISTDAHDLGQMDMIVYGVETARRGWLEKKDIVNTYGYEKMVKVLRRNA